MSGFVAYGGARRTPRHDSAAEGVPVSPWSPLKRGVFFALWIAALASNLGTWMQNVGAAWLMTSLSRSPLMVSLIQTASSAPIFLLALAAGALADIVDRRRLLIFSQAWMLAASGILAVLTLLHLTTAWTLLLLSFLLGAGSALNAPAWQAIIPELVPRDELAPAITLNGINFNLARAVGPALGGLMVAWMGAGANFALNAASFLGVMIVLYQWRREARPGVLPAERVLGAIRAGLRFVRYAPELRAVLVRTAAFVVGASAMWAMLPLFARWQLGLGAAGFGFLLAWFGTGAVVGGAMLTRLQRSVSLDAIVHGSAILYGVTTAGLALTHNPWVAYALLAMAGAAWVWAFSLLNVAAQLAVPQWVQGRALGCYQLVLQGGLAAGSVVWGVVGERYGVAPALVCGSVAMLAELAAYRYRLADPASAQTDPAPGIWPEPSTAFPINADAGPAMITVEYRVNPGRAEEFVSAMRELRTIRMRDGAVSWGLFVDTVEPDRFVEYFVTETWIEHLRQHERVLASDVLLDNRVKSFNLGPAPPAVTHLVSADAMIRQGAGSFRRVATGAQGDGGAADSAHPPESSAPPKADSK